ncbi:HAD family hydrolase [Acidianus brierleyi]|uniref:2-haloalkanoic acid dehalogenase n=1 Tax=Acidianus brierleyi TaxID=41673 RepID=A0A2U9IEE0_9CREN|nr:HAD-IA family hydrolase [Acidianus brierleyi]AWR94408.1 HAD-IA family hydrolase [Acidianus brierleyi]
MEDYNEFEKIRAIFFDFDNTLVDFETNSKRALDVLSKELYTYLIDNNLSLNISSSEINEIVTSISCKLDSEGVYDRTIWIEKILEKLGISVNKEQIFEWVSLYWSIASDTKVFDDVQDTLDFLKKKGYKLGIITNSDGEGGSKSRRLENFPLIKYFDIIVIGGENNIKPKPSVQPFIVGCEKLSLSSDQCVMVGDDPVKDCLAAKKAGLNSILIDRQNKVKFAELYADLVIRNIKSLQDIF